MQYSADPSSTTWFPIQTLHVCAAVKAVKGNGSVRFVSLDTAAAQSSSSPPMFACIMRRTKGVKVLECHVFICKSNQAAMALVQSCTHAFEHKEGHLDTMPTTGARIFNDTGSVKGKESAKGGGLFGGRSELIQKFDVSCNIGDNNQQQQPNIQQIMPQQGCGQQQALVPMNPPGAPVPMGMPGMMPGMMPQMAVQNEYFADWNAYAGQPLMIIPESPFYPGEEAMGKKKNKKKKKKDKKKKKKNDSSSDEEEETYYIRKSALGGSDDCDSMCGGDSLRSKLRGLPRGHGHGHGHGHGCNDYRVVEEVVQPPPPPPPQQIIFMPQPQPEHKNQQNPNTDVVVYAPQIIEANKDTKNIRYDDRDNDIIDYRPDNREYRYNSERRMYDGRADNRINYNRQHYRNDDFRADARQYHSNQDNRALDYRADNRSNRMSNKAMGVYGDHGHDDYDYDADEEFRRGYYNAQVEEYNRALDEYNYHEDDDLYYPQPGYCDDYGAWGTGGGRYELDYVDDYVVEYVPASQAKGQQLNQMANGLGYYP